MSTHQVNVQSVCVHTYNFSGTGASVKAVLVDMQYNIQTQNRLHYKEIGKLTYSIHIVYYFQNKPSSTDWLTAISP